MPATQSAALSPMTGGTSICLCVVLLVNKCHYLSTGREKDNVCCNTLLYCTREITLSWKLLFCMLKINKLVIKLFFALYCFSICVYICVSWIFTCMVAYMYFMFSLLFLLLTMTTSLCLSPILRFNKTDWIYLQSHHM